MDDNNLNKYEYKISLFHIFLFQNKYRDLPAITQKSSG